MWNGWLMSVAGAVSAAVSGRDWPDGPGSWWPPAARARFALPDFVDVHGVLAVLEALHLHLDRDFLDAFGRDLFGQRGGAGHFGLAAALEFGGGLVAGRLRTRAHGAMHGEASQRQLSTSP